MTTLDDIALGDKKHYRSSTNGNVPKTVTAILLMTATRATLIDVARHANTSKTSVSRFFGPERAKLSVALQARIEAASLTLGYQPNLMARGLKGGGSRLLGMLVADIRNPFSVAAVYGVEQAARAYGYSLIVCSTDNDPEQERRHLALLTAYQAEGLIVNATGQPAGELRALQQGGMPVVLLDREIPFISDAAIGLNNALAVDMALDHLESRGYRSLLYISNAPNVTSARQERLSRFIEQSAQRGLEAQTLTTLEAAPLDHALMALAHRAHATQTAVLCANATVTLRVVQAFKSLGLTLGDIGLIGIDELDWCELVGPGITTLAQPTDAIGRAAVARLLDPTRADDHRHAPRLIARGSTLYPDSISPPLSQRD